MSKLMTAAEAAEYLNTSVRHIARLRSSLRLPVVKVGGLCRYHQDDLDAYIEANRGVEVASVRR